LEFIKVDSGFGLKEIEDKLEVCRGEKPVAASVVTSVADLLDPITMGMKDWDPGLEVCRHCIWRHGGRRQCLE